MANVTISQLNSGSALSGSEVLPIVQAGSTVKTTVQDIANLAGGGGSQTLDITTVGTLGTSSLIFNYTNVVVVSPNEGTQQAPVVAYPTISISAGMGFTGTVSYISFSNLTSGKVTITGIPTLYEVNLPVLTTVYYDMMGSLSFANNSSLNTINIPSLTNLFDNGYFQWTGNAFYQATVDHILVKFAATTAINGSLNLSGGSSAAPSSVGLAAIATLQGRGWNVQTN